MIDTSPAKRPMLRVMSLRDFRLLFIGATTSLLGDQFALIATPERFKRIMSPSQKPSLPSLISYLSLVLLILATIPLPSHVTSGAQAAAPGNAATPSWMTGPGLSDSDELEAFLDEFMAGKMAR